MVTIYVKQTVKDYDVWKTGFLNHSEARKAAGSSGGTLLVNSENKNEVHILFEWDNMGNMKKFMESDELKAEMKKYAAGVPDITVLDKVTEF